MTYLDLINQFWQKDLEFSFTSTEVDVYFRLLDRCNRLGWKSPFNLSVDLFMAQLKLRTKKPFDTARKALREAGLIDFKNGNGRGCTTEYTIIGAGSDLKTAPERGNKNTPLSGPLSATLSGDVSGGVSGLLHKSKTRLDKEEANASGVRDEILAKKKGPARKNVAASDSPSLLAEKITASNPVAAPPSSTALPPSFEEFWQAFGKKEDRHKCQQRWGALKPAEQQAAITAVPAYVVATPEKRYRKNPLTWLNGKCWLDEETPTVGPLHGQASGSTPSPTRAGGAPSQPKKDW